MALFYTTMHKAISLLTHFFPVCYFTDNKVILCSTLHRSHITISSFVFGGDMDCIMNTDDSDKKTGKANDAQKLDINNLPDLLTVREVADLLRVSPLTIKRWGKRGKLPAIRINSRGDRRYKKEAVLWLLGVTPSEDSEAMSEMMGDETATE
ncbi:MAG: helix-turn-helix domain-containing protein [bacterium]|nr:helix-turn-helix domain-containing protein [bacterium]